jgi:ABC-type nitrate/sulfonate/bicarbonate transport system permease component
MNAQSTDIQASIEFASSASSAAHAQHSDWSFLPTAVGGLAGVAIGVVLGFLLGLC